MYKLPAGIQEIFDLFPEAKEVIKADDFQEVVTGERAEVMFSSQLPDAWFWGKGYFLGGGFDEDFGGKIQVAQQSAR